MSLHYEMKTSRVERGSAPARRRWRVACVSIALLSVNLQTGLLRGQDAPEAVHVPLSGLGISRISGYAVYYSNGQPEGVGQPTAIPLPSDLGLGGSLQIDWTHTGEKSKVLFTYAPSYTGRLRFAAWNALNHFASFDATRRFGKWEAGFSARADLSNMSEFLFQPTVFANVVAVPASFSDLASAVLTGNATNPQLASLLTGAPLVESPARNLFFGDRMFTSTAQTSITYKPSPRLGVRFNSSAGRTQHVAGTSGTAQTYLIPRTSFAAAALDVSYARSARTQVGVSVSSSRVASALQDVYSSTATVSLGRTMGTRWFLQVSGGMGIINPVRSTFALTTAPEPVGSGTLGFRTSSHVFMGAYTRTVSDSIGLGANTTSGATGSWRWGRPGRTWWIENSVGWQQLAGSGYANTSSWRVQSGFGRVLFGDHIALLTQYVYLHYSQQVANLPPFTQSAVRVSMTWNRDPRAIFQ